jgi:hypothetical protein
LDNIKIRHDKEPRTEDAKMPKKNQEPRRQIMTKLKIKKPPKENHLGGFDVFLFIIF